MFIQPGEKGECFPLFPPNDKDKNKGEIIMAKKDKILNTAALKQMMTELILELNKSDSHSEEVKQLIANDKFRQEAYGVLKDYMVDAVSQEMNQLREETRKDMEDCIKICKNVDKKVYKLENKIYNLKRDVRDLKSEFEDFKTCLGDNLDKAFSIVEKQMKSLKQSTKKLKEFVQLVGVECHMTDGSTSFNKTMKRIRKSVRYKNNRYDNNQNSLSDFH